MIDIMPYKKIVLILVIGLTNVLTVLSQDKIQDTSSYDKSIRHIVQRIDKQKYLMTNYKIDKKIIRLANKLAKAATDRDLINLTDSKNRVLSCIAFWILVKRVNPIAQQIFNKNEERNKDNMVNVNRLKRYKFDVIIIYTDENFYYEVYKDKKYLDLIKNK